MTRKDYELIAAALRSSRATNYTGSENRALYNNGVDNAAHNIARALQRDNPRFDRERFLVACGVTP